MITVFLVVLGLYVLGLGIRVQQQEDDYPPK